MIGGISGSHEVEFVTEPAGATVLLDNGQTCVSPCTITVHPMVQQNAKVTLNGYDEQKVLLYRRITYSFWGNFIFGIFGVITAGIDWLDGYIWTFNPSDFHLVFTGKGPPKPPPPPEVAPPEALDSAALARLKESFPEDYMARQIRNFYGEQSAEQNRAIMTRLYKLMLAMQAAGERVDVDEAVRQDRFNTLDQPQGAEPDA